MKYIPIGKDYCLVLHYSTTSHFLQHPSKSSLREECFVINKNGKIILYTKSQIGEKLMTMEELIYKIKSMNESVWRDENFRKSKIKHYNEIYQIMRDNIIDEVLSEDFIWQFA